MAVRGVEWSDAAQADASLGEALCQLAMGMDGVYRRSRAAGGDPALHREGLVPIDLWGGPPLALADWPTAIGAAEELQARVPGVADPIRRLFLEDTLRSLETMARWQCGEPIPFRTLASRLLGLAIEPLPMERLRTWRASISDSLGERGYAGTPPERVLAWERDRVVPAGALRGLIEELLREAHERTAAMIRRLPGRPLMGVDLVSNVPYTAYCDYVGGVMRINADQPYTRERLKLLVLHEAYPGHDFHLYWREYEARAGLQPADSLLTITNTPSSPLFEGIGDNGAHFLGWMSEDERLDFDLATLRSAACVNACLLLHEEGASPERVRAFLVEEGCGQPTWADTRLRFMRDSLRAPFIFSYYGGYAAVAEARARWQGTPAAFYSMLYGRMHSPRSLLAAA